MILYEKTKAVLEDWQNIVNYTLDNHGEEQTLKYTQGLQKCMDSMAKSEGHYKDIDVDGHIIRVKHCQKHYLFALLKENEPMLVLAIFHERMDLMKRLKKRLT
jgi:plasmid stabilization system protein ParE